MIPTEEDFSKISKGTYYHYNIDFIKPATSDFNNMLNNFDTDVYNHTLKWGNYIQNNFLSGLSKYNNMLLPHLSGGKNNNITTNNTYNGQNKNMNMFLEAGRGPINPTVRNIIDLYGRN